MSRKRFCVQRFPTVLAVDRVTRAVSGENEPPGAVLTTGLLRNGALGDGADRLVVRDAERRNSSINPSSPPCPTPSRGEALVPENRGPFRGYPLASAGGDAHLSASTEPWRHQMRRLMLAGCVAAALGCSTTKDVVAAPAPAPQPVVVTSPAQPSTVVVTPQSPPTKVIVVPSNN
jgi:hypothetical protein